MATTDHRDGQGTQIQTPAELAAQASRTELPNISGFKILREIGRGGMGIVYRALDNSIDREVAVKVLHERYARDSTGATRFIEEARITGQLQHPGIPAVHQIGTLSDGRPYLAMKLIRGETLESLLHKNAADNAPNWLAIFEAICQAVGYAHAHNVIHRDLKPANVMVGRFGEVQVMDWGLAKVLRTSGDVHRPPDEQEAQQLEIRSNRESETLAGSIMGTPAYMPPEQAIGDIALVDQRSDVFSLGAILCEILTGKPIYAGKVFDSILRAAMRCETEDAVKRLQSCGAEPSVISLAQRCLAKEILDRPADANVLAHEASALRANAEQRARDAEIGRARAEVQATEQRKRRRIRMALLGSVLFLVIAIIGGIWWRNIERRLEADTNNQAFEIALDQAEFSLRKPNPIEGEIDAALAQAQRRLNSTTATASRNRLERLAKDRETLRRLDEIDYQRWMISDASQKVDQKHAELEYPIIFREYGFQPELGTVSELAEILRTSAIAARLSVALDAWWAISRNDKLLQVINELDDDSERRSFRAAYANNDTTSITSRCAKLDGRNLPPAFAEFVGSNPLTPQDQAIRILKAAQSANPTYFGLAVQIARRLGVDQSEQKVAYYRIALALRPLNTLCLVNIGHALHETRDYDGAVIAYKNAIQLNPNDPIAHSGLGYSLHAKRDLNGAIAEYKEALRLSPNDAITLNNLGWALHDKNDLDGAIAAANEAIRLNPKLAMAHNNLGWALQDKNDLKGAIAAFSESIKIDPGLALAHLNLGYALQRTMDLDGAVISYREAIKRNPSFALAHMNLGIVLRSKRDFDGAILSFKEVAKLEPNNVYAHLNQGLVFQDMRDTDRALAAFKEAVRVDPRHAIARKNLGISLFQKNELAASIAALEESKKLDPSHAATHNALGIALAHQRHWEMSIAAFKEALRLDPNMIMIYSRNLKESLFSDLSVATEQSTDPNRRESVHEKMGHWLSDEALSVVRDADKLQKMPQIDRQGWEEFWMQVKKLRDQTANGKMSSNPKL